MDPFLLLAIHATVMVVVTGLVWHKYRTAFNPVTLFAGFYALITGVIPYLMLSSKLARLLGTGFNDTVLFSSVYFAALGAAYLTKISPLRGPLTALVRVSRPFTVRDLGDVSIPAVAVLALEFVASYCALMIFSGAGTMWLTNTREAYSYHRAGVGVWWALALANLMLLFIVVLFRWGKSAKSAILLAGVFMLLGYRLGSKSYTIVYLAMAVFFVHFCRRRIGARLLLLVGVLLVALVAVLLFLQGSAENFKDIISSLDYFPNTARFISGFQHFGLQYGNITLSNLWYYVPRALYPAKPFVYGQNLLTAWLHLGAAKQGFTPGMLQWWVVGYADFGVLGVIAAGLVDGWISKAAYEYFLLKRNVESMVLLWQLGFLYVFVLFPNAPFPIFWAWFMAQGAIFWVVGSIKRSASEMEVPLAQSAR